MKIYLNNMLREYFRALVNIYLFDSIVVERKNEFLNNRNLYKRG